LEHEDRLDEALQSARQAMELQPWFRPGVQILASLLCQLNRDDEALQILAEASARMESGMILWQLAALEVEMRRFADACDVFARMEHYLPLLEDALAKQLAAMHADAAYQNGDFAKAARFAPLAKHPYFDNMAERLSGTLPEGRRRILPVDFVRQHHQTCAPATLAALCRYWSKPADQQEIAEEIKLVGKHLAHVHIHDNHGGHGKAGDEHLPFGRGTIDIERDVRALRARGYEGHVTLEIFKGTPDDKRACLRKMRRWARD